MKATAAPFPWMPALKRLTLERLRDLVDRLGPTATWAELARRTGHSTGEVRRLGEAHGIVLRASNRDAGPATPADRSEGLTPAGVADRARDIVWDPLSEKLPPIARRDYESLLGEWWAKGRAQGDRTPFDVLFRDHRDRPRLEAELSAAHEKVSEYRSSGPFRRGYDEGHRKGVDEGYAQGRTDSLSKVLLPCAACRQPVLVDFGEKGGAKTGPRRLLETYLLRDPVGPGSIAHADCAQRSGYGIVVLDPASPDTWSLARGDGPVVRLDAPPWPELRRRYLVALPRLKS